MIDTQVIDSFEGKYLSNFHLCVLTWKGHIFQSSEHIYQWEKTLDPVEKESILINKLTGLATSPGQAKRQGRKVTKREDWELIKVPTMREIQAVKYSQNSNLGRYLLDTDDALLIEGNTWHDNFFGDCRCGKKPECKKPGLNVLGNLLMELRDSLRKDFLKDYFD